MQGVKMYKAIIYLLISLVLNYTAIGIEDVDFEKSNDLEIMKEYSIRFDEPVTQSSLKLELLRKNYERLKPSKVLSSSTPLIPKVIHQIWLGGPMPKNYQYYSKTWKQYHPDWEVKLWTEEDLLKEKFSVEDLYWQAESYQERADIMRYAILNRYGGVYVDTDIECLANYDELNHKYEFYAGMESPVINKMVVSIPNSLIAAKPDHPILTKTIENLRLNWKNSEEKFEAIDSLSRHVAFRSKHFLAVQRSMYPFTESVYSYLKKLGQSDNRVIVLPASFNTPIFFVDNNKWNNLFRKLTFRKVKLDSEVIIQPETMSLQHYGKERKFLDGESNFDKTLYGKDICKENNISKLKEKDKYYLDFSDLFNKGFSLDKISYEPMAIIPTKIYLDGDSNLSPDELLHLKSKWQEKNRFFTVGIIDDEGIESDISYGFENQSKEVIKKISTFIMLYVSGGVYTTSYINPVDLHEFNYKFSYYGKFVTPKNVNAELKLDANFIAIKPGHVIIMNILSDITNHINKFSIITESEISMIYKDNVYKYNQLDGRNIIFPESVFEQQRDKWVIK
jgi:hypothetical protein